MSISTQPFPELISLLESSNEPHVVFDRQYRVIAANKAYREQNSSGQGIVGRRCYEISHHFDVPCDQAGETCPLAKSLVSEQRERVLHLHYTPKGEEYVDIELTPIRSASGEIEFFVEKMVTINHASGLITEKGMVGRDPLFRKMLELVARVAQSNASVLLEGESGTGKELVANALHQASHRANAPFIAVDCSGIPESLFESELFGHERGSFTGAIAKRKGLVEAASGGTLFLDEVGEIPLNMQVKLLRLIETGTYRRVGATELLRADIRVISATHRSLQNMVESGLFRADLFYRLNVFPIRVPALRERISDLPLLVSALLVRIAPERKLSISDELLAFLGQLSFKGNIRELRNILERASLMCDGAQIEVKHLQAFDLEPSVSNAAAFEKVHDQLDLSNLTRLVKNHQGSRADLAAQLGVSERTLYRWIKKLDDWRS